MRGSAGTGKTSLAGAMVRTFSRLGQKLLLMAPTGRAAKVFAMNSGHTAFTIHRKIYREKSYSGLGGQFSLNENMHKNMLFMIDEASMIGTGGNMASDFGSGNLLSDLVQYVYNGQNCRMILVGDSAQLPPVGEAEAPALDGSILEMMGLKVYECDLNEVLRQSQNSGILANATYIRSLTPSTSAGVGEHNNDAFRGLAQAESSYETLLQTGLPRIRFHGFADIIMVPGDELV